jgi:murein DD-endopeptidase MepM/ murein hydrolase activator NlpD
MKKFLKVLLSTAFVLLLVGVYYFYRRADISTRNLLVRGWFQSPQSHPDWMVRNGEVCGNAPFAIPTTGFIGYLYGDSFRPFHRHQGIDIFSRTQPGETPVTAAYPGYLTRLPGWKSSVIIRIPNDPLHPGRQIWTYYTHMADQLGKSWISDAFPQGSSEIPVKAGDLLGYQGNFSGDPNNPVGVHLHFSIVKDDGNGHFLNELEIANTIDPSDYFQINLNKENNSGQIPICNK